ncbi:MAG TPA: hypothetical protein VJ752_19745 [Burkholderiaceae bacterium]|nr:hypothetical protein [Burkholderiaceae bacterium]
MFMIRLSRPRILLVLLLYLAALGVAISAPIMHPKVMDLVCSSTSIKLVKLGAGSGDGASATSHTLDCALCMPGGIVTALPSFGSAPAPAALAYLLRAIPAARLAGIVAAPLPARGPPHFG